MTDREKLIEILAKYFTIGDSYEYSLTRVKEAFAIGTMTLDDFVEFDDNKVADIADHLIANGVTVREMQKPLTVEEASETIETVWYEYYRNPIVIPADVVYSHSANFLEIHKLGAISVMSMREDAYGKTWRCWAEKPTEEERKAAEWEK